MTKLLIKLFIKNYSDTKSVSVRSKYGIFSGVVGIILNVILCITKIFAGLLSGSVSIIADAVNNLSDAASAIISLVGFKMSIKPADKDHPFGHGRIEYISALLVSVAIIFMGYELLKASVLKLFNPTLVSFNLITIIVLSVSVLIKLWLFLFNRRIAKIIKSESVSATAFDSLSDAAATFAVLLSLLFFKFTNINIDAYMGVLVSFLIFFAGCRAIREALAPLLGEGGSKELACEIEEIVLSNESVIGIHDLVIHNYGAGKFMMSLHAEVSADSDILVAHDEIDLIEKQLSEHFNCTAVIHMDPIVTNNEEINRTKKFVTEAVCSINPILSIHDFRMVKGPTHTNLIFDLVVPFDFKISDEDVLAAVKTLIGQHNDTYYVVATVEKSFIN